MTLTQRQLCQFIFQQFLTDVFLVGASRLRMVGSVHVTQGGIGTARAVRLLGSVVVTKTSFEEVIENATRFKCHSRHRVILFHLKTKPQKL